MAGPRLFDEIDRVTSKLPSEKAKTMKHQFVVKAHYPEAVVKHAYQDTKVIASDDAQAAK